MSWRFVKQTALSVVIVGAITAGASGLRIAWANQAAVDRNTEEIQKLNEESRETLGAVIRIEKDIEYITRGIKRIEQAVEQVEEEQK